MKKTIHIKLTTDKNGKPLAHKWLPMAGRYVKMNYDEAKFLIATGAAEAGS